MTDWQDRFVERRTMTAGELATRYNRDNFRLHPETQKDAVEGSLDKLGFFDQIKFSSDGGVFDGHLRIELALEKFGPDYELPVDCYDLDATETQQALILKDQTAGMAEIDVPKFEAVWNEFQVDIPAFDDWVTSEFEFGQNGLGEIVEDEAPIDKAAELQDKWGTRLGQLWQLGEHRLICGDCTDGVVVEAVMDGKIADMLFTDPPYGVNYEGGHFHSGDVNIKRERPKLENDHNGQIYNEFLPVVLPFVDGPCYVWFASSVGKPLYDAIASTGCELHAMIVWHKINAKYAALNAQYKQRHEPCMYFKPKGSTLRWIGPTDECTVWEEKRDAVNDWHPTQKPVVLSVRAMNNHDANLILDCFCGSGSTISGCEQLNRKCRAIEIDPGYVAVTLERWHTLTGQEPKLIS